jgi:hypothetical protein
MATQEVAMADMKKEGRRLADMLGYHCLSIKDSHPVEHAGHDCLVVWMQGMGDDIAIISRDGTRRWWVYRGIAPQRSRVAWDDVLQGRWGGELRR